MHAQRDVRHRARDVIRARAACGGNCRRGSRAHRARPRAQASTISARSGPASRASESRSAAESARGVLGVDRLAAGKRGRIGAHLRAALHAGVAADRHQRRTSRGRRSLRVRPRLRIICTRVAAEGVLRDAHAPDEARAVLASRISSANSSMLARGSPACASRARRQSSAATARFQFVEAGACVSSMKRCVDPALLDQNLQHAVEERDVAALRDREPVVHDVRAEERAAQPSTAPSSAPCPARGTDSPARPSCRASWPRARYFVATG